MLKIPGRYSRREFWEFHGVYIETDEGEFRLKSLYAVNPQYYKKSSGIVSELGRNKIIIKR